MKIESNLYSFEMFDGMTVNDIIAMLTILDPSKNLTLYVHNGRFELYDEPRNT